MYVYKKKYMSARRGVFILTCSLAETVPLFEKTYFLDFSFNLMPEVPGLVVEVGQQPVLLVLLKPSYVVVVVVVVTRQPVYT